MASLGIRCGGLETCLVDRHGMNLRFPSTNENASLNVMMSGGRRDRVIPHSMSLSGASKLQPNRTKQKREQSISSENVMDKWMKDSVGEIVKNLREAPLLVQVYSDNGNGKSPMLKTEKAVPESWRTVKSKWENGTTPLPEGVIFVEQLKQEEAEESAASIDIRGKGEIQRAWGIVVQSKVENCGPACYLLKTSRAGPGPGLGFFCTHFCLVKVKSFMETAEAQLKNCWLSNGN